ncbi:MAG: hypothetical protein JW891_08285 [Candidatus Lokiarchaeota archaeon]|nr:hypothetical protein [Candidatus Lokiarchaeota archaeon]
MVVNNFERINILDNFYQTSSFFPMPIIAIGSLTDEGETNIGPYSLVFPYYIAGKDHYTMLLEARNNSNTARNILKRKKCSLNFVPDDKKFIKQCVALGFPGDSTEEKMKDCIFTLVDGQKKKEDPEGNYPKIIGEAYQVFECTWLSHLDGADKDEVQERYSPPYHDFNGITSEFGAHFILRIDNILMKSEYKSCIVDGVSSKGFPNIPVDYGYRDNTNFWIAKFKAPYAEAIPKNKAVEISTVQYAADRMDPDVKFTEEACAKLVRVPRIFLKKALKGCVDWAKERSISLLTAEHMDQIRDKRSGEKSNTT